MLSLLQRPLNRCSNQQTYYFHAPTNRQRQKIFTSDFKALVKRHGIQHIASVSKQKVAVVERFNQIIKTRIWTYLSDCSLVPWVDVIQDLLDTYNHTRHRSISMAPADVQNKNENRIWVRLLDDGDIHLKPKFLQRAMVRASSHKKIYDKGYMLNFTKGHFTVN